MKYIILTIIIVLAIQKPAFAARINAQKGISFHRK
jgi:hypothetical protein